MIKQVVKRQLEAIDWDFPANHRGVTKNTHWYPGTFPSQLPAAIIQALSKPGEMIFDPYGGSGTTAAEAIRLNRKAWVVDINPIGLLANYVYCALLISKRKSKEKTDLFFKKMEEILGNNDDSIPEFEFNLEDDISSCLTNVISGAISPNPEVFYSEVRTDLNINLDSLSKWFSKKTLNEINSFYQKNIINEKDNFTKLFLEVMVSSNLRALCSQTKSWGHIADNVYPKQFEDKSPLPQYKKWLSILKNSLNKVILDDGCPDKGVQYWCSIHDWTSTKTLGDMPDREANLMVTSPPYADAIDYIFSQKLSFYYFGYTENSISMLCSKEIGARRKRTKSNSRNTWATQLSEAMEKQVLFLKDGIVVAVLPHKDHGREIGLNMLSDRLGELGWSTIFEVDRSINQKKTRHSWTSIKKETIRIFKEIK